MRLKSTLVTISVITFGVALGGFLGYFLGSIFNTAHAESEGYIEPILDNIDEINDKFNTFLAGRNIEEVDLTTSPLSVSDIYNVADSKMHTHEKVLGIGKVLSLAKNSLLGKVQTDIFCTFMKDGNGYLVESATSSTFVNGSNRFVWKDTSVDETQLYHTSNVQSVRNDGNLYDLTPIYTNESLLTRGQVSKDFENPEGTNFTQDNIKSFYGRGTNVGTVFVVANDSTLLTPVLVEDEYNGNETATTSFQKTDDGYVITLCLDPQKAVINYAKQMGFENPAVYDPVFEAIIAKFYTTKDLTIYRKEVHEKEYVYPAQTNGGEAPTINKSVDYYIYDDEVTQKYPEYDERIDYSMYWEIAR